MVKKEETIKLGFKKWKLPSELDGNALLVRSTKAEGDLKQALNLLYSLKESIPHTPATETKQQIENFIVKFL